MSTLRSAIEELRAEDVGSFPDAAIEEDLAELIAVSDTLEAEVLRRLAAVERRRSFERDGFLSTVSWLVAKVRMSRSKAAELVRVARSIGEMPRTEVAFASGEITGSGLRILAHAQEVHPQAFAGSERLLVEAASSLPVGKLEQAVAHWEHATGASASAEELLRRRWIRVSPSPLGMGRIAGDLDPETNECVGTALQAAVDADLRSLRGHDDRTPGQRRADALREICRSWLDSRDRPDVGSERPHVNVTVDIGSLRGRGDGSAELDHSGVTDAALARWFACDASVSRVVIGPRSEPLDLGRRTPVVPSSLRRAVAIRDGGCRFPACDRPHAWCDAHHAVHWADGGETAIGNLVLLCRPHHRLVHSGFGLRMVDGRPVFTRPDGSHLDERAPP